MTALHVFGEFLAESKEIYKVDARSAGAADKKLLVESSSSKPLEWDRGLTAYEQLARVAPEKNPKTPENKLQANNFLLACPNAPLSKLSATKRGSLNLVFSLKNGTKDACVFLPKSVVGEDAKSGCPMLITQCLITECAASAGGATGTEPLFYRVGIKDVPLGDDPCDQSLLSGIHETAESRRSGPVVLMQSKKEHLLNAVHDGADNGTGVHLAWVQRLASLNANELFADIQANMFKLDNAEGTPITTDFVRIRLPTGAKDNAAFPASTLQWIVATFWHDLAKETMHAMQTAAPAEHKQRLLESFAVPPTKDQPAHVLVLKVALLRYVQKALERAGRHTAVIDGMRGLVLEVHPRPPKDVSLVFCVTASYALFETPEHIQLKQQ